MRDFPFFTTEYGVSSIFLKEIPYKGHAFIWVRSAQDGVLCAHLRECAALCRMAGAERIFVGNHSELGCFPLYTRLLEMQGRAIADAARTASIQPVTAETAGEWREIYNQKLRNVDCAATLEYREEAKLPGSGACFVVRENTLLGIGWLENDTVRAVASLEPGAGEWIMRTLMGQSEGKVLTLEVASTNHKAVRLYRNLGFETTRCIAEWREIPDTFR